MLYRVYGANSVSGEDDELTLKAESEDQAAHAARVAGLLVERVEAIEEDALQTLSVAVRTKATTTTGAAPIVPAYRGTARDAGDYLDIARGARVLRIMASILNAMGWVSIAYTIIVHSHNAVTSGRPWSVYHVRVVISWAIGPLSFGTALLVVAALLRFIAAIGLAIRDVAAARRQ